MFGVSILSIVIALGFEYLGHKTRPKKAASTPAAAGPGGQGEKQKVSGVVLFQHKSEAKRS
ncbi:hypothetical protein GCM10010430_81750 [Kitasatospora cystarginea]|uniref:Uncharacterized protein n=1 Tax=Kitasatospora cystarginea TaxID=58350 RepID=A0ABP5S176_9ACTN